MNIFRVPFGEERLRLRSNTGFGADIRGAGNDLVVDLVVVLVPVDSHGLVARIEDGRFEPGVVDGAHLFPEPHSHEPLIELRAVTYQPF